MRVLFSGGEKTINLVNAMKKTFSAGTIEVTYENNIKDIRNFISRGDQFDRAIVMQRSITEDEKLVDEAEIRNVVSNFIGIISSKFRKYEVVFIVMSDDMARIVCEESFSAVDKVKVVVKKPEYTVSFFKEIMLSDINKFPDNIEIYNYEGVDTIIEDNSSSVEFSFNDEIGEDNTELTSSNEIEIEDSVDNKSLDLAEASFEDTEDSDDGFEDFDIDNNSDTNEFEFGSIDDIFNTETEEDSVDNSLNDIEENNEFGLFENTTDDTTDDTAESDIEDFEGDSEDISNFFDTDDLEYGLEDSSGDIEVIDNTNISNNDIEYNSDTNEIESDLEDNIEEFVDDTFDIKNDIDNDTEDVESLFSDLSSENMDNTDEDFEDTLEDTHNVDSFDNKSDEGSFDELKEKEEYADGLVDNTFEIENSDLDTYSEYSEENLGDTVEEKIDLKKSEKLEDNDTVENEQDIDAESLYENISNSIDNNDIDLEKQGKQFKGIKGKSNIKPSKNKRVKSKENKNDKLNILNTVMSTTKHRGNIILVTGNRDSGKSMLASNLANVINKLDYTVLTVDMDTKNRGLAYSTKDVYETVHIEDPSNASLRAGINTANSDMTKFASIVKPGYHLLTMGLANDMDNIADVINPKKLNRFMSSAKQIYNYIIIDAQFEDAVTTLKDVCESADNIIITSVPTNHGMMELLLNMTNIEDEDIQESLFTRAKLLFTKVINIKTLFGFKVKSLRDMLDVLDKTFTDLTGYNPEWNFSNMGIAGVLNYSDRYEDYVFNRELMSDTKDGEQIFLELLYNILVNKEMD